ncbi:DUF2829 domain-containing protein [Xenorhabdus bovienii]|uniref:Thoeris anti-defense Tad2 family protein n=1 Tax=Xenorhabdus bovienii TaxID=40576 RepID=UPI0023B250BB|nr:MW1434 family type I TA system toxin [Xenorhabdus bovienii]MDE9484020.1 DUF2829 domain-containing protein [Xenorhabdus bovienii]MDE9564872.1 DUF2829 domain-containing protein [Xenorhabdus bovienii]
MSEINKPENQQADLKCPFNPNQYNIGDENITVPAGTSAWALSLVYLGNKVHRSGWNAPVEHMRLAHKSEVGSADDGTAYIEKSDRDGYWSRWIPTQEDLMACDWKLLESVCPEDSMLVFDLKSGNDGSGHFGYKDNQYGTLNIMQNEVDFKEILFFKSSMLGSCNGIPVGGIFFKISYDIANYQKVKELFKGKLYITVDDVTYNIGHFDADIVDDNKEEKTYAVQYNHCYPSDIDKLYKIISQDKGVKRYYINWSDKPSPDLNNILEFDIKLGASEHSEYYGYSSHDSDDTSGKIGIFGNLYITKNNTEISNVLAFYYYDGSHTFILDVPYNDLNAQKIAELFEKNLYVTVDNLTYKLGAFPNAYASDSNNKFSIFYNIHDDPKLLKLANISMETGETKRFLLTWINK